MVRSLRSRHRKMIMTLVIVVPVGVVASLIGRKSIPRMDGLPVSLSEITNQPTGSPIILENVWKDVEIETRVFSGRDSSANSWVELQPTSYLQYPELLVYWHDAQNESFDGLPPAAALLGRVANSGKTTLQLPHSASRVDGMLILYSLAQQHIVATAKLSLASALKKGGL